MDVSKKSLLFSAVAASVAVTSFAAQEDFINIENLFRVGYDDNVRLLDNAEDTAFMSDVLNIEGARHFSGTTSLAYSYKPEFRFRVDGDPKAIQMHDAYVRLNHELSSDADMVLTERMQYQLRDAASGGTSDMNYFDNNLQGAVNFAMSSRVQLKVDAGYGVRIWEDKTYGETQGNNYDGYKLGMTAIQSLGKDTKGMVSANYSETEYDGSRGSMDVVSLYGGLERALSAKFTGFAQAGMSAMNVDSATNGDATTPYVSTGVTYMPTEKTSVNGTFSYQSKVANNSYYNAMEQMSFRLALKQQLTSKFKVSTSVAYTAGSYDSDYIYDTVNASGDAEEDVVTFGVRGSYELDRNNFLEVGYEYSQRDTDVAILQDYERNRIDIGWRVRK